MKKLSRIRVLSVWLGIAFILSAECLAQDVDVVQPARPATGDAAAEEDGTRQARPRRSIGNRLSQTLQSAFRRGAASSTDASSQPAEVTRHLVDHLRRIVRRNERDIAALQGKPAAPEPAAPDSTRDVANPSEPHDPERPRITRAEFAQLLQRHDDSVTELARLKGNKPPAVPPVHVLLDAPHLGLLYVNNGNMRCFVARLIVVNSTDKPVVLKRKDVRLTADAKVYPGEAISSRIKNRSFMSGRDTIYLGNKEHPDELTIAAGQTGSMWVGYDNLPNGNNVPALSLDLALAGQQRTLDVTRLAGAMLGLTVERVGPRGALGLLTIAGSLNTVNIGRLVEVLDGLVAEKVFRVVVCWKEEAPIIDQQMAGWLMSSAEQAGRARQHVQNQFPMVPTAIRELHLARMPRQGNDRRARTVTYNPFNMGNGSRRQHKTIRAAVSAALRTVYKSIPPAALLREIEEGHPLTRAAALENGGGRLADEDLPLVLDYAEGDDPLMQRAALVALRHFGTPQAIGTLLKQVGGEREPQASLAIASLAGSRYASAHAALLGMLKQATPELKKKIVAIVARYPRPVWADVIHEFATSGDASLRIVGLRALVRMGHPQVAAVLEQSLQSDDAKLRGEAFNILVTRTDSHSEELALRYTLAHLEKSPPTQQMLQLLRRTRDRRAIAPLLKQFEKEEKATSDRANIIGVLAAIGDQSVVDVFLEHYSGLTSNEQAQALSMLWQFRSPRFRELAGKALLTKHGSLVNAACRGLQEDGSPQAVALLINAFETNKHRSAWSYISNALTNLGSPAAREALKKATHSKDANRRQYAINALRNLRQRSPGYQYIYMARQYDKQKKWKESIEQYTLAAQLDPKLPEAYSGRGNALMRQNKHKEAGKDFERALKLDPFNSIAVTGLGIVRVIEGKPDEGIQLIEESRKKFENDALFAYNAACVYGRAIEAVQKNKKGDDNREKLIARYQKQALADLKQSVKLGFRDRNWMKKDPDLKSLHGLDEFKKIHSPAAGDGQAEATEQAAGRVIQPVDRIAVPIGIP